MSKIVNLTIVDKQKEGINIRDESIKLARLIGEIDLFHYNDYFCIKYRAECLDNKEILAYIIDDLIDHGLIELKIIS